LVHETTCMLVENELVCDCFIWKTIVYNRINLITKIYKILICFLNMIFFYTLWLCGIKWMKSLWLVYACIFIVCYYFSSDRIEQRVYRGGGVFEYQEEEDQGQATQGKPSKLVAYLNPIHLFCRLHKGLLNCMFLYCYSSCSNSIMGSSSTSLLLTSFEMTPLNTYSLPL
jgi:hypothetical protein